MSTQVAAPTDHSVTVKDVSFPGVLYSEWVKVLSLRSTYWTVGATLAAMVLVA